MLLNLREEFGQNRDRNFGVASKAIQLGLLSIQLRQDLGA